VARIEKQNRIADALEAAQNQPYSVNFRAAELSDQAVNAASIAEQIGHIQTHVNHQLTGLQGTMTIDIEAEPDSPYVLTAMENSAEWNVDSVPLESEKDADYTKLRDLLRAKKWKEADYETYRLMITIVGRKEGDYFRKKELLNFPCKDLKTIDRLWVQASQGHYGFSVQKEIYVRCGAKLDGEYPGDEIWEKFGTEVGWRVNNSWQNYDDLTWNIHVPGHLPVTLLWRGRGR